MKLTHLVVHLNLASISVMAQQNNINTRGVNAIQIGNQLTDTSLIPFQNHPDKIKYLVLDKKYNYFFSKDSTLIGQQSAFLDLIVAADAMQNVAGIFIMIKRNQISLDDLRRIFGTEQLRSELGFGQRRDHVKYYWETTSGTTIFFVHYIDSERYDELEFYLSENFEDRPLLSRLRR
jgi:hypothetical protein